MAVPAWAQYYLDKNKKQQEEMKASQQAQIWQDTMASRAARKETNGVDPALANVKEPTLSKAKRIAGQFGLGVLQGASDLGKSHGAQVPDLRTGLKTNVGFQVSPKEMSAMETKIGAKNTTPEKIVRGFGEFVPGLTLGGGLNKAAGLTKLAGESGAAYKSLLGDKLLGKAAESATKQLPDMLTTWGLMEGPKAQEERTSLPIWAAQWAGSDLALKGIGKGLKVGIGKLGNRAIKADLTRADLQPAGKLPGMKSDNMKDWNHIASKTDRAKVSAKGVADTVYSKGIDDLNRLKQIDKDSYILALNSREAGGIANFNVTKNMTDAQGNVIGESLKDIGKQIPKNAVQDFENYLVYRHAPSWLEQGRTVFPESEGITADVARQRAAAYEAKHPEFKELGGKIVKWQRDFGKAWLVDTGIVKPETWNKLQEMYPDYVPFQRLMKETEANGTGAAKRSFANQNNPLKKAQGSQREIISPIESIIEHTDKYVKIAKRNEVMQTLYSKIKQDPEAYKGLIEILPEKGETFESIFSKEGMDGFIKFMDEPFEQMKARKNVSYDSPEVVRGMVNGETVHFKVQDPQLLDAISNLSPQGQNVVIEGARQVTRMMKVLTTGGNPVFATRNIARDLPMAYVNSETLTNIPVAREAEFAWGIMDSLARIVTGGKYDPGGYYKSFKAMGGGSHSSAMAADRNLLAESKAGVLPGYYSLNKPVTSLGRGLKTAGRGIEKFTNAVETLPRLPEYVRTAKQGGNTYESKVKGLFNAQDVTVNFSKQGNVGKSLDAFIPYLNAALQGLDKLGRTYGKNPVLTTYRSLVAITVPAVTLWMINKNNPNYHNLSSWTKDNYFCIPTPGGKFLKIAKPREAGIVFGSLVERSMDKWAKDDPNAFKGFSEAWVNSFAPPVRWIGAPLSDIQANKNFAGSPIVPKYMENLSPELQYDETTSKPAIKLGGLLNVSPKKVDYLTRSYTGVLGELGIPASSEGRGENAVQRVGNVLNKTFFADPLYSNDTLSNFYDEKDKLDKANSDFKATKAKSANYNPAKAKVMSSTATKISDINKKIRAINSNQSLSYEEKDRQVRALKQKSLDLANYALAKIQ